MQVKAVHISTANSRDIDYYPPVAAGDEPTPNKEDSAPKSQNPDEVLYLKKKMVE